MARLSFADCNLDTDLGRVLSWAANIARAHHKSVDRHLRCYSYNMACLGSLHRLVEPVKRISRLSALIIRSPLQLELVAKD